MADESKPQPLDYRGPRAKRFKFVLDAEGRRWRRRRFLFRLGLFVVIGPPVIYFGANYFVFGKMAAFTSDFVPVVQADGIPAVRAIMEYQRDNGQLPGTIHDLAPKYLSQNALEYDGAMKSIDNGRFRLWVDNKYIITYDLAPGAGQWRIDAPFGEAIIPMPPVTIGPATQPNLPGQ